MTKRNKNNDEENVTANLGAEQLPLVQDEKLKDTDQLERHVAFLQSRRMKDSQVYALYEVPDDAEDRDEQFLQTVYEETEQERVTDGNADPISVRHGSSTEPLWLRLFSCCQKTGKMKHRGNKDAS